MVFLDATYGPVDLEIVTSFGDTSAPELAMLGYKPSNNASVAELRDASTDTLVGTVTFDSSYRPLDMEVVSNFAGSSAPELVVLSEHAITGLVVGEVRDASSGSLLKIVSFTAGYSPKGIKVLPSFADSSAPELGFHGVRESDGRVIGEARDASTGVWLKSSFFNVNYVIP